MKENTLEELREATERLEAREAELAKREAALNAPKTREEGYAELRDIVMQAGAEKRAITLSGTGAVAVVNDIVEQALQKNVLIENAQIFYGPNASTIIPIFSPMPAVPAYAAEGASSISPDSTGALGATSIQPFAWVSELKVSYETLKMCGADFQSKLPGIFAKTFRKAMSDGVVNGAGTTGTMKGFFAAVPSANKISCAASGAPALADIVGLAMKLKDLDIDDPCIVISPTFYTGITAASASGYDFYREELIRNHSIEGVEVIITGKAPSTTTAGDIMAVATSKSNYGIGVAAELTIEPIRAKGDTNTYFQAIMCFNGKPIVENDIFGLVAVAAS